VITRSTTTVPRRNVPKQVNNPANLAISNMRFSLPPWLGVFKPDSLNLLSRRIVESQGNMGEMWKKMAFPKKVGTSVTRPCRKLEDLCVVGVCWSPDSVTRTTNRSNRCDWRAPCQKSMLGNSSQSERVMQSCALGNDADSVEGIPYQRLQLYHQPPISLDRGL
jgi:hypothetical protein